MLLSFAVNFGQRSYSASYDLFLGASKMGTKVVVTQPGENMKVTEFGALYERASNTHNVKVFVSNKCIFNTFFCIDSIFNHTCFIYSCTLQCNIVYI